MMLLLLWWYDDGEEEGEEEEEEEEKEQEEGRMKKKQIIKSREEENSYIKINSFISSTNVEKEKHLSPVKEYLFLVSNLLNFWFIRLRIIYF
jgi:hypothetical protein